MLSDCDYLNIFHVVFKLPSLIPTLTFAEVEQSLYNFVRLTGDAIEAVHKLQIAHMDIRVPNVCLGYNHLKLELHFFQLQFLLLVVSLLLVLFPPLQHQCTTGPRVTSGQRIGATSHGHTSQQVYTTHWFSYIQVAFWKGSVDRDRDRDWDWDWTTGVLAPNVNPSGTPMTIVLFTYFVIIPVVSLLVLAATNVWRCCFLFLEFPNSCPVGAEMVCGYWLAPSWLCCAPNCVVKIY